MRARSSTGLEHQPSKLGVTGSSPVGCANTPRYFRCQDQKCRRKWHIESLKYESGKSARPPSDLFDTPKEVSSSGCPMCGGSLEPELGTFEEMEQVTE